MVRAAVVALAVARAPLAVPVARPAAPLAVKPVKAPILSALLKSGPGRASAAFDGGKPVPDFGAPNGTEVRNRDAVLPLVDKAVGTGRPADFSYVLVSPFTMAHALLLPRLGFGTNPYSHALAFYTRPDGTQAGYNIVGKKGRRLVNAVAPADYLYSTKIFDTASEQGGLYNRTMDVVRIERLAPERVQAVEDYYRDLDARAQAGKARFALMAGPLLNLWERLKRSDVRWGNCGYWSGGALAAAGLAPQSMWPKLNWIRVYERARALDPANVHVVRFEKIWHAVTSYGVDAVTPPLVAPLHWLRSWKYRRLKDYADVIVETPPPGIDATVTPVAAKRR